MESLPGFARLKRMAKAFIDGLFPEEEYSRQKKLLTLELEGLVVPAANAAEEAGKLVMDLPRLWPVANDEEKRQLLLAMLDGVYVDARDLKRVVGIKPKPAFRPIFEVATTRAGSRVSLVKETPPEQGSEGDVAAAATPEGEASQCSWWRRGRVELPVQERPNTTSTSVAGVL